MALQTSGQITFLDIQNEFGGSNPISLNEYYGADAGTTGYIPTSGTIRISDFYGAAASFYNGVIDGSVKWPGGSALLHYMTRTPSSAGSQTRWTYSAWIKIGSDSTTRYFSLLTTPYSGGIQSGIWIYNNQLSYYHNGGYLTTNRKFTDVSAWYHIVVQYDSTTATTANRVRIYVNGEQETSFSTATYPAQYGASNFNSTTEHLIGASRVNGSLYTDRYYDGYMADINFIDGDTGSAWGPDAFGELKNGVWIPKAFTSSYGTNGFHLDFATSLNNDQSGNGNNWTAYGLGSTDLVLDTPENNFCTLNPNANFTQTACNLFEGNLKAVATGNDKGSYPSSFTMTSGKWYWEVHIQYYSNGLCGIVGTETAGTGQGGRNQVHTDLYWLHRGWNSTLYYQGSGSGGAASTSWGTGDLLGFALDVDGQTFYLYKNGTLVDTQTNIGVDEWVTLSSFNSTNETYIYNFGQDSSFAGQKTAQGNTDGNGHGDFYYTPPSGYLALCAANHAVAGGVDLGQGNSPADHFDC